MNRKEELTEVKKAGCQEDRIFNASCHCEEERSSDAAIRKNKTGLLRSLRSLAMTKHAMLNKSCHPEFISGSVHSEKCKLPWNKTLNHLTDTGSQGSSLACSLCKVQDDKIVCSLCKVQNDNKLSVQNDKIFGSTSVLSGEGK